VLELRTGELAARGEVDAGAAGGDGVERVKGERAGGREVAVARVVRALVEIDRGDGVGDEEVGVGVAVIDRVAGGVDRDVVDDDVELGALARVVAADEQPIGLAAAGDQHRVEPGQVTEQIDRPAVRLAIEVVAIDVGRGRGIDGLVVIIGGRDAGEEQRGERDARQ
jgi:hypothetical protein